MPLSPSLSSPGGWWSLPKWVGRGVGLAVATFCKPRGIGSAARELCFQHACGELARGRLRLGTENFRTPRGGDSPLQKQGLGKGVRAMGPFCFLGRILR